METNEAEDIFIDQLKILTYNLSVDSIKSSQILFQKIENDINEFLNKNDIEDKESISFDYLGDDSFLVIRIIWRKPIK